MSDTLETINPDQVGILSAPPPAGYVFVQSDGGPLQKLPLNQLLAKLIAADLIKPDVATLDADLDHDEDIVALVVNDPDPLNCGWYRKVGASGDGSWEQFEQLSKAVMSGAATAAATAANLVDATIYQFYDRMLALTGGDPSDRVVLHRTLINGVLAELLSFRRTDGALLAYIPQADELAGIYGDQLALARVSDPVFKPFAATLSGGVLTVLGSWRRTTGALVAKLEDTSAGVISDVIGTINTRLTAVEGLAGAATPTVEQQVYVAAGALKAVGGPLGARTLDNDGHKTWLSGRPVGAKLALAAVDIGVVELRAVSLVTGQSWPAGEISIISDDGQSNGEGEAEELAAAVRTNYTFSGKLRMLATAGLDVWCGQATTGGSSLQLSGASVTGLTDLKGKLIDATHGTTSAESAALRYCQRGYDDPAWVPDVVVLNNCEGGQTIANLRQGAPGGFYAFANVQTKLTKVAAFAAAEGKRAVWRYQIMTQGESDAGDAALGSKHDGYRSECEGQAVTILGQTEPLRMLSWQMSSFYSNSAGARSILTYHKTNPAKFRCLGPTYPFPMSAALLHHSSVGHDKMGEYAEVAMARWNKSGDFQPLCAVSAAVTGGNQITVTMSEAVAIDTALVPAATNYGLALVGTPTISAVAVAGANVIITTTGAASGATAVQIGMSGHVVANGRQSATQARTNLRSAADYGQYRDGSTIYNWAGHEEIAL